MRSQTVREEGGRGARMTQSLNQTSFFLEARRRQGATFLFAGGLWGQGGLSESRFVWCPTVDEARRDARALQRLSRTSGQRGAALSGGGERGQPVVLERRGGESCSRRPCVSLPLHKILGIAAEGWRVTVPHQAVGSSLAVRWPTCAVVARTSVQRMSCPCTAWA